MSCRCALDCAGIWLGFFVFAAGWEALSRYHGKGGIWNTCVDKLDYVYSRPANVFIVTSVLCVGAIVQCCLFVRTYAHEVSGIDIDLDILVCLLYTVDTFIRLIIEEAKRDFVTSPDFAIDVFIVPSVAKLWYYFHFYHAVVPNVTFNFLASLRLLRTYRRMHVYIEDRKGKDSVVLKLTTMVVYSLIFLFFTSTMFFLLETLGDLPVLETWMAHDSAGDEVLTFFSSIYFVMVTISTVGYGDILPTTVLARIVTISFIIGGIIAFSIGTSELLEVLSRNRAGRGSFTVTQGFRHVIVTGNPNFTTMKVFLQEFFHPDHEGSETFKVVLRGSVAPLSRN